MPSSDFANLIFLHVQPSERELEQEISQALCDRIRATCAWAFKRPLYDASAGMFYLCNPAFDLAKADAKLPYEPTDAWLFYPKFEKLLREHFGEDIMRTMAWDYVRENGEYFDNLIFMDAFRRDSEIAFLAQKVGVPNCTSVFINHIGMPIGVRTITMMLKPDEFNKDMDRLADVIMQPELPLAAKAEGSAA